MVFAIYAAFNRESHGACRFCISTKEIGIFCVAQYLTHGFHMSGHNLVTTLF